jgi:hypothetical protein
MASPKRRRKKGTGGGGFAFLSTSFGFDAQRGRGALIDLGATDAVDLSALLSSSGSSGGSQPHPDLAGLQGTLDDLVFGSLPSGVASTLPPQALKLFELGQVGRSRANLARRQGGSTRVIAPVGRAHTLV